MIGTVLFLIACGAPPPDPERHHISVDAAGGAAFGDIHGAIAAARDGDTIEVAPGNYFGSIDFSGKSIRIVATGGPSVTTIFASPGRAAVTADHAEGAGTALEGFTIRGGGGEDDAVIENSFAVLSLVNVALTGNEGEQIVDGRSAFLTLDRVTIDATNVAYDGVVIEGKRGLITLEDSTIACGANDVGYAMEHGAMFLDGVTFDCPGADAIRSFNSNGRIQRSTFDGEARIEGESKKDEATHVEGAIFRDGIRLTTGKMLLDNVVVDDEGVEVVDGELELRGAIVTGADCGIALDADSELTASYTIFWDNDANVCGGTDAGNVEADPMLDDDFRPAPESPCIDAGDPGETYADVDGTPNDVGAYGGPFTMDGGW